MALSNPSTDAYANEQAERMNHEIKAFHYPVLETLKAHLLALVFACIFANHFKARNEKRPIKPLLMHGRKAELYKTDSRNQEQYT